MSEEDTSSLLVNAPIRVSKKKAKDYNKQPVVKTKTALERIFGSKKYAKDHYFSDGSRVNDSNVRDVLKEASPFKYPEDLDEFAYKLMSKAWESSTRCKELQLKYNERSNYITRQRKDILNRMYVRTKDVKSNKTILDIDPEFYTIVEGRPINVKFNIHEYMKTTRDILRTKIVTGYRMDDALLIEENLLEEQNMITEITKQYMLYLTTFEEYLANDHEASMMLLRLSESETQKAYEKYEAYREVAKELGVLKSQVSNMEEKWRNAKMYQKFLYLVSPMYWRKQYDYYHIVHKESGDDAGSVEVVDSAFDVHRVVTEYQSLDDIIEHFLKDYEDTREPMLFFQEPDELVKIFRFIELQNLNSLLHSEELAIPLENIKQSMAATEEAANKHINDLQEIINNLEGEILWEEERAVTLEALARELINGEFRRLICDDSILNLLVIVEDVYESRVAPNDANISAYEMMKAIELKYREFLLKLDFLPYDKVNKAETDCYAEQLKIMKVAKEAAAKVLQIERLVKRLRRMLEPHVEKHIRDPKKRSKMRRTQQEAVITEEPITEEEREYFYLFTDFCEDTDSVLEYREIRKKELKNEEQVLEQMQRDKEEAEKAALNDTTSAVTKTAASAAHDHSPMAKEEPGAGQQVEKVFKTTKY